MSGKPVLFVIGARPNFVKIAPVCSVLDESNTFPFRIVHTGQHYDKSMSGVFFEELGIPQPDYFLNVGSGTHGMQTGQMMISLESLCQKESFSAMIVIGDVNSTMAGALVGAKLHIPVIHIEAGLRSYNRRMPEEVNRIATDHISDLLFAPSERAMSNLDKEGIVERAVFSGDVMFDMVQTGIQLAEKKSRILQKLDLVEGAFFLATLHRPYNVDDPKTLRAIILALSKIESPVVLAAHPRLRKNLDEFRIPIGPNILMLEPLGYLDFIRLQNAAKKIITDSGGVQKEAFFLRTPCLTLRPETEWVETVDANANILVRDRSEEAILKAVFEDCHADFDAKPYGDGHASDIIVREIASRL